MIYEYLHSHEAYGKSAAIPGDTIRGELGLTTRRFDRILYRERKAGKLIYNKSTAGGGYYLPSCVGDVIEFVRVQESRIKKHAVTLRAARAYLKDHGKKLASSH